MHKRLKLRSIATGQPMAVIVREYIADEESLGDEHVYLNRKQLARKEKYK
jgi:hypothetical protein